MNTISIIFPVYNEVNNLEKLIDNWYTELSKVENILFEFIICEDGSTDGTKDLIKKLISKYPIKDRSVNYSRGYGQAIVDGIYSSKNEYILCVDSDGQIKPESLLLALSKFPLEEGFLIGKRTPRRDPFLRIVYSKIFKVFHNIVIGSKLSDPSCPFVLGHTSEYKKLPKELLLFMKEGFWWGFVAVCTIKNIKLEEMSISHFARSHGFSQVYKIRKMPGIIYRNCVGLIKIKLFHKKYWRDLNN